MSVFYRLVVCGGAAPVVVSLKLLPRLLCGLFFALCALKAELYPLWHLLRPIGWTTYLSLMVSRSTPLIVSLSFRVAFYVYYTEGNYYTHRWFIF